MLAYSPFRTLLEGGVEMATKANPVLFIHGLWLHASSWGPWEDYFGNAGYDTLAPGWPGDQDTVELARANPDSVADKGIDDVTDHYASIIDGLSAAPIVIGHSFGGMIAEKLLGLNKAASAIGIDAAQIKGVLRLPLSSLHATLPVFKNPANKHKAVSLTAEQFRSSFGNALSEEESNQLYEKWAVPSPGRPLFEAAAASPLAPFTGQGRHRQPGPRSASAHDGRQGPHRPRSHHQVDTQAIPSLAGEDQPGGVRRSGPLPHHRQWMVGGGRGLRGVVGRARALVSDKARRRRTISP